jgi:hypothetical protein
MNREHPDFTPEQLADMAELLYCQLESVILQEATLDTLTPDDMDGAGSEMIVPFTVVTALRKIKAAGYWEEPKDHGFEEEGDTPGDEWKRG